MKIIRELIESDSNFRKKNLVDWSINNKKASVFVQKRVCHRGTPLWFWLIRGTDMILIFLSATGLGGKAITVASVCLYMGVNGNRLKMDWQLLSLFHEDGDEGRINNCQLIEDYYNSDPGSLAWHSNTWKHKTEEKLPLFCRICSERKGWRGVVQRGCRPANKDSIIRFIGIAELSQATGTCSERKIVSSIQPMNLWEASGWLISEMRSYFSKEQGYLNLRRSGECLNSRCTRQFWK